MFSIEFVPQNLRVQGITGEAKNSAEGNSVQADD